MFLLSRGDLMAQRDGSRTRATLRRRSAATIGVLALGLAGTACSSVAHPASSSKADGDTSSSASSSPSASAAARSAATVATNVAAHGVPVDKTLTLTAKDGTFSQVTVKAGPHGALAGGLSGDKRTWTSQQRL